MSDAHVFVTLGDVTHIECDAWLLPTDSRYSIRAGWSEALSVSGDSDLVAGSRTDEFSAGAVKATPIREWPVTSPLPILTAVPNQGLLTASDLAELREAVAQFVGVATRSTGSVPGRNRSKKLLAMPAFGTDGGGGAFKKGEILEALLGEAHAMSRKYDVDVVLVLRDERAFALAQQLRKQKADQWSTLTTGQLESATRLAGMARSGKLVPFMGAGVSVSAGGPTWPELIAQLAYGIGMDQDQVTALASSKRSALDQAAYLRELYRRKDGDSAAFEKAVVDAVSRDRYGLAPSLLASLRTEQAITLNYDTLFEIASEDVGDARTIIPADGSRGSRTDKWLLKLHGSVRKPETIVLTRDDYLGYSANREALSAIVKANLITHHLLFVGFGLSDDHFHQIIHDVRRAAPVFDGEKFGTALTMLPDELDETLWEDQLDLIAMGASGDLPGASRQLEVFLDALLAHATDNHSYLLDESFASSLSTTQDQLRGKLLRFKNELNEQDKLDASWSAIERMFKDLGLDN